MTLTRVALVTGAGSGIGRGVALSLATRQYHVVCAGRRLNQVEATVTAIGLEGGSAEAVSLDVCRADQVDEVVHGVAGRHGRLDVLVNSAGIFHRSTVAEQSEQDWRETIDINLTGVFLCCRAAIAVMAEQDLVDDTRGHLVSINSGAGVHGFADGAAYSAAKHGLRGLVDSLRLEVAAQHIKVTDVVVSATVESQMSAGRDVERLPASTVGDLVAYCVSVPGAATIDRIDFGQLQH